MAADSPSSPGTIAGARLVATSTGAAFGPARSAPGVSKLVCDDACGDSGCRQDIDQRGAEFDQQYGSIVATRQLHRSQRISSGAEYPSDALLALPAWQIKSARLYNR